jgi:pyruvate dehydrogenase E2 component (dihydrolipoamide acetyltransferase)
MTYDFRLPDLGEGVTEGEIAAWLVEIGDSIAEDDPMVEVETDKATVDIPSPVDGVVAALHAAAGDRVPVGALLITVATDDAPADEAPAAVSAPAVATAPARDGRREPLRGVRRRIAERLTQSHREVPKVTVVEECDFSALAQGRGELSFVPFIVRAAISGLKAFPDFNATIDGDDIVYLDRYDIGVAAQGTKGLVVPVLHGADGRSLVELDGEVRRLAQAVRDDTIAPQELNGGTFTVTLAGKLGGYFATPLVNPGEAAILGVHRIAPRPVVRDGEIVVRDTALISCSFDHRITDGTRASMFLLHVIDVLQSPGPR